MTWWSYVRRHSGTDTQADISRRLGLAQASVSRWVNSAPKPENVVAFANAYGRPVLEAFVAAGFLDQRDITNIVEVRSSPSDMSDEELLAEVGRRMARQPARHQEDYGVAAFNPRSHRYKDNEGIGPSDEPEGLDGA